MNERYWSGKSKFYENWNTFLLDEFIETTFDIQVESMYTFKGIKYY